MMPAPVNGESVARTALTPQVTLAAAGAAFVSDSIGSMSLHGHRPRDGRGARIASQVSMLGLRQRDLLKRQRLHTQARSARDGGPRHTLRGPRQGTRTSQDDVFRHFVSSSKADSTKAAIVRRAPGACAQPVEPTVLRIEPRRWLAGEGLMRPHSTTTFGLISVYALVLVLGACSDDPTTPTQPTPFEPVPEEELLPLQGPHGSIRNDGNVPPPTRFNKNLTISVGQPLGLAGKVYICIWDHGAIDGDRIRVTMGTETLWEDATLRAPEYADWWSYYLAAGYYYPMTVTAHNEGSISPNTGTVAVSRTEGCSTYTDSVVWEVPLRTNGSTSIIVTP